MNELDRKKRTLERIEKTKVDLDVEDIVSHAMATNGRILALREKIEDDLLALEEQTSRDVSKIGLPVEVCMEDDGVALTLMEPRDLALAQQVTGL